MVAHRTKSTVRSEGLAVSSTFYNDRKTVNKFGFAPAGVQLTATDIWDRADATPTQQIWVAPTQARTHTIDSNDIDDTNGGAGANTVRVYGLTAWDTDEVNELVTLNDASPPTTVNSYVIIHRMSVETTGATGSNEGLITATATTDGTVTAQINVGEGQTQMAIYGIPSTQTAYMVKYYVGIHKAQGAVATIESRLLVNEEPETQLGHFNTKHVQSVQSTGTTAGGYEFDPYFKISGPAIIKVQGIASAADVEGTAGFDLILVDN